MNYTAEAYYTRREGEHGEPFVLASEADVEQMFGELLDGGLPDGSTNSAHIYLREMPDGERRPADVLPDHELKVGVDATAALGALHYWHADDFDNAAYTAGVDTGGDPIVFQFCGEPRRWNAGCLIPGDEVVRAVKEFLQTGSRPTCVQWKTYDGPVYVG